MTDIPVQSIPALARKRIRELVNHHGYNYSRICKDIGISRPNLDKLIAKHHAGDMYADMVLAEAGHLLETLNHGMPPDRDTPVGGVSMAEETLDQKNFKARLKKERIDRGLSWSDMDRLLDEKRLDVMAAPSSRPSAERISNIIMKLEKLPAPLLVPVQPDANIDASDDSPVAPETHAVIDITHDSAVMEAAQELILATVGIDLDELKQLAPTIDKLIAANQLGLDVSLHIAGGTVKL